MAGRIKAAIGSLAFLGLAPGVVAGRFRGRSPTGARCRRVTALALSAGQASS